MPLENDDFILKNGHLFCNSRYVQPIPDMAWLPLPISHLMKEKVAIKCTIRSRDGSEGVLVVADPLAEFHSAFSDIMGRRVIGKIVLRVADGPKL